MQRKPSGELEALIGLDVDDLVFVTLPPQLLGDASCNPDRIRVPMEKYILEELRPLTFSKVRRFADSSVLTEKEFVAFCSTIYEFQLSGERFDPLQAQHPACLHLGFERDGAGRAILEHHLIFAVDGKMKNGKHEKNERNEKMKK